MDVDEYIAQIVSNGHALAQAASAAGWDAVVPPCPEWTVRDLVAHVGGVHRWAAEIVRDGLSAEQAAAVGSVGVGPDDAEMLAWYLSSNALLVSQLQAAPDSLECFTFLPAPSPLAFWARRQAHETAIHRVDAESAAGSVAVFGPDFAQDGIAEMAAGFSRRRRRFDRAGTLALSSTDGPSWLAEFDPEGVAVALGEGPADATVTGTSSDLYLWLCNRPSAATLAGDAELAAQWGRVRVRWS